MAQVTGTDKPTVLGSKTLIGDKIVNKQGEDLGELHEIMVDLNKGGIGYAVLRFGGVLGVGDKLFAVPWDSFTVDVDSHQLVVDMTKDQLQNAPGFDKDNWPDMDNPTWQQQMTDYYGFHGEHHAPDTTSSGRK